MPTDIQRPGESSSSGEPLEATRHNPHGFGSDEPATWCWCKDLRGLTHNEMLLATELCSHGYWRNGMILRVKCHSLVFSGSYQFKRNIVSYLEKTWERDANIQFKFVDDEEGYEILVSTGMRDSDKMNENGTLENDPDEPEFGWCYLGTEALKCDPSVPTMSMKYVPKRATVVHEFGHALGVSHEHQRPVADIQWKIDITDEEAIRAVVKVNPERFPLDWLKVASNKLDPFPYDPFSVMHDELGPSLVEVPAPFTRRLSGKDKRIISYIYPRPSGGSAWLVGLNPRRQRIHLPRWQFSTPRIALGITSLTWKAISRKPGFFNVERCWANGKAFCLCAKRNNIDLLSCPEIAWVAADPLIQNITIYSERFERKGTDVIQGLVVFWAPKDMESSSIFLPWIHGFQLERHAKDWHFRFSNKTKQLPNKAFHDINPFGAEVSTSTGFDAIDLSVVALSPSSSSVQGGRVECSFKDTTSVHGWVCFPKKYYFESPPTIVAALSGIECHQQSSCKHFHFDIETFGECNHGFHYIVKVCHAACIPSLDFSWIAMEKYGKCSNSCEGAE